jgi:hypothetical protein
VGTRRADEFIDDGRIGGRQLLQMCFEALEVRPGSERFAVRTLHAHQLLEGLHADVGNHTQVPPECMEGTLRRGAGKVVDGAVEDVATAVPGSAQAARPGVHLEDGGAVSLQLGVATGRQPANACADDENRSFRHGPSPHLP